MLTRLLIQYFSLLAMRRSSTLLLNGRVKVYQVNKTVIPFSFGNSIFLNQHLHGEEELKEIIRHEFIHVKQRHTFDIIWSEVICILTWYNPFSWLLRKAIRQNLEFIADQQVLKTGLDRREYQYLLLKVIGVPSFSIASNFNFKSLKKRIAMMNKVKSARVHLVRFLSLLPVVAILLVAFRNATKHRQLPPGVKAVADTIAPGRKGFPENVKSFHYGINQVTVTLKDGKEEKYDMSNEKEKAAFEKKYGQMPDPPTPPEAPAIPVEGVFLPPPAIVTDSATGLFLRPGELFPPAMPTAPFQDDCYNEKGYCLAIINSPKGQLVMVVSKTKKEVELVYLDDWKKDNKYENKFGKLPAGPPPPPRAPVHPPTPVKYDMPDGVSSYHVKDFDVILKKVDGTVDKYDLRVAEDKANFEKKVKFLPHLVKVGSAPVYGEKPGTVIMDVAVAKPPHDAIETINAITAKINKTSVHDVPLPQGVNDAIIVDEEEVLAVITKNTTFKELEQFKTDLKSKGITLTWIDMKVTDGKLTKVEFRLTAGSDKCYLSTDGFTKLILTRKKGESGRRPFSVHSFREKITD